MVNLNLPAVLKEAKCAPFSVSPRSSGLLPRPTWASSCKVTMGAGKAARATHATHVVFVCSMRSTCPRLSLESLQPLQRYLDSDNVWDPASSSRPRTVTSQEHGLEEVFVNRNFVSKKHKPRPLGSALLEPANFHLHSGRKGEPRKSLHLCFATSSEAQ